MPRPDRIEFEGAFHHVMNRGRNHGAIFHDERYFNEFLKCLEEASEQFDAVIHAYCLMTNHYHLLIETPLANLGRIMRHINGVYTQRHNWLKKSDGSLFKGRYKAVLVDEDDYLLQLTRYIHLNPIETKKPMVTDLADYPWSSYPAYINKTESPDWLERDKSYQMLGHKGRFQGYRNYVQQGADDDLKRYYGRYNILSVLGNREFKEYVVERVEAFELEMLEGPIANKPGVDEIIRTMSEYGRVEERELRQNPPGKRVPNPLRGFTLYACRQYGDVSKKDIAAAFKLSHPGSSSYMINKIRKEIAIGGWKKELEWLKSHLLL